MNFDTQFDELVLAVALCDYENVERILSSEWYDKNTVNIMRRGRNIGFNDEVLTIHNIAQCWELLFELNNENPDLLASWNGEVERLHVNNTLILELLRHKFTGSSCGINFKYIQYGLKRYDDVEKERENLRNYHLRQIDEELFLSLYTFDLDRFEQLIRSGANPWAYLSDGDCVWERIVSGCSAMINNLQQIVLEQRNVIDLKSLFPNIIEAHGYCCFQKLLHGYMPYESKIKCTPIKTISRVIYHSRHWFVGFEVDFEINYDPETNHAESIGRNMFFEVKDIIPEDTIASLLSKKSINQFMNLEIEQLFQLDGGHYTMEMIDSAGSIRRILCNDCEMKQVPQMILLEKYAEKMRKDFKMRLSE